MHNIPFMEKPCGQGLLAHMVPSYESYGAIMNNDEAPHESYGSHGSYKSYGLYDAMAPYINHMVTFYTT